VARALPDVDVDLAEMVTREQVAGLLNEEVDLGLARPAFDAEAFGSRLLHREALLVAAPAGTGCSSWAALVAGGPGHEPVVMHSPDEGAVLLRPGGGAWSPVAARTPCTR
jgi:DNA-binding transcriptional LysR family regulator